MGGPGEYLLNFGILGVLIGGLIYGFMLRVFDYGYRKLSAGSPFAVVSAFVIALIVVPEGSVIQIVPRTILWIVPFLALVFVSRTQFFKRTITAP